MPPVDLTRCNAQQAYEHLRTLTPVQLAQAAGVYPQPDYAAMETELRAAQADALAAYRRHDYRTYRYGD